MPSLKKYLERADELTQDVISAWNASAASLSPEFWTLLRKALLYKSARHIAENHRAFDILSKRDEIKLRETRMIFARAYQTYCYGRAARLN